MNARKVLLVTLGLLFCTALHAPRVAAQLNLPRASPKATISQTVGLTDITITYSRPGVKGRPVWGALVPYDQVWRTGANEATVISFSDDVMINGTKLAAGKYSLHTIPSKGEWTVIFNREADQWGSYQYDEKKDALRVKVKPETIEKREWMQFTFPAVAADSAQLALEWDTVRVPLTIGVEVRNKTLSTTRAAVAAAKPDDWRTPLQAATYFFQNDLSPEDAAKWVDQSLAIQPHYGNLGLKARMLAKAGNFKEAISYGEKAIAAAKASPDRVDTSALERLLGEWRAK